MKVRRAWILAALLALFVGTIVAQGDSNGNGNGDGGGSNGNGNGYGQEDGNNGNGNGNGNTGPNNGNGNGNGNMGGNNGNGNGNGNLGGNNGNGNGNGNAGGNNGNGNGNGNAGGNNGNGNRNGNGNGNRNGYGEGSDGNDGDWNGDDEEENGQRPTRPSPPAPVPSGNYESLSPVPSSGQERGKCLGVGACLHKTLTCPSNCPQRKPKKNRKQKGCFIDCSSRCQATCKWRKPDCNEKGSICYDPRFVGGDGVMFYFHGSKGNDFAILSDQNLHINAHFIGNRPAGRTRDFTWVQALSLMFDTNTLLLAANRVSHWDNNTNALLVKWNGDSVSIPTDQWTATSGGRQVLIERTVDVNTVRATVSGLVQMDIRVVPIGEKENRVHHYQLPSDDVFAHLEVTFRFFGLSEAVEGVLGKTYRAGYLSPVKRGVPMPIMGGEDKYRTPSLYSPSCKMCVFQRPSLASINVL